MTEKPSLMYYFILGGWPLVGLDINLNWSINAESGFLTELLLDSEAFFSVEILPDSSNTKKNIPYVSK